MDVTIDNISAEVESEPERGAARPEPSPQAAAPTDTELPELTFMTRRERLRSRLTTF